MRPRARPCWQDSRSTEARLYRLKGRHETLGVVGDCLVSAIPLINAAAFDGLLEQLASIESVRAPRSTG
jgi:hypothetical protein